MVCPPSRPRRGQLLDDLRDALLAQDPALRAAWEALEPRRRLVSALLRLRRKANLTQRELAAKAGWDPAFVSRLESFPRTGEPRSLPDLESLARYAGACGSALGLVFGQPTERGEVDVAAAVSLSDDPRVTRTLAAWPGRRIGIRGHRLAKASDSRPN